MSCALIERLGACLRCRGDKEFLSLNGDFRMVAVSLYSELYPVSLTKAIRSFSAAAQSLTEVSNEG
jgi:hypothetical protein